MKAPVPAPVEWHPVTQKAREEAERMGSTLAAMKKKDNMFSKHVKDHQGLH